MKSRYEIELSRLYKEKNGLKASDVVASAKSVKSPLHDYFVWDNNKAGHEFRLLQARTLIRTVKIEYEHEDGSMKNERLVHVPSLQIEKLATGSSEGNYQPVSVVVADESLYTRALIELRTKVMSMESAITDLKIAADKMPYEAERSLKIQLAINAVVAANVAVTALC